MILLIRKLNVLYHCMLESDLQQFSLVILWFYKKVKYAFILDLIQVSPSLFDWTQVSPSLFDSTQVACRRACYSRRWPKLLLAATTFIVQTTFIGKSSQKFLPNFFSQVGSLELHYLKLHNAYNIGLLRHTILSMKK